MPTLDWLTRPQDLLAANNVPYRLLEEVQDLSCAGDDPATENMLIQGDNLDALKALLPIYAGQVKCIFIDPPYNTRSAFEHYDDNLEHPMARHDVSPPPTSPRLPARRRQHLDHH